MGPRHRLIATPALASWDKAGSPGQLRSAAFIDGVQDLVALELDAALAPLGLLLEVGLPTQTSLLALNDLDNYLFPMVPRLTSVTGREFASVWAVKSHAADSHVAVGPVAAADPPKATHVYDVATTAAASTTAFKEQIRDQLGTASPLPDGPVELQLAFVVGPRRAWPNLWKPAIDALGAILGHDKGARQWNARDGRITQLGLHCVVDKDAGNRVRIAVAASASATE